MAPAMVRLAILTLALAALLASPAAAARNDGPYAPFPEGDPSGDALRFVQRLNYARLAEPRVASTATEIERLLHGTAISADGRPLPAEDAKAVAHEAAFRRAGVSRASDRGQTDPKPLLAVALLLAAGGVAFELRGRRVRSRTAAG